MSQLEALTITALGMAVVFIGLVACIAFIRLFGRLSARIAWGEEGHGHGAPAPAPVPEPVPAAAPAGEPIPAEVLAVISTVLQVERKLYLNRPGSRVTIRRSAPRP
ncbi:MAG TPA: OadG family protein [Thermoanaerobaculia bacterium]|nr:OadG family protein [Thermoanaerobaculia bacterium]HQN06988.1 OadG family protein [Thermoanaerobaculia bacterium]HQP84976.1 OadG family protein [Thermoanaerobaculia bacterium]